MKFFKDVSWTLFSKLFVIAGGVAVNIVIARYLGATGKGIFFLLQLLTATVLQFANIGLPSAACYYSAKESLKLTQIAGNMVTAGFILGSGSWLAIAAAYFISPSFFSGAPLKLIVITLLPIPALLAALFAQHIFLGRQQMPFFNLYDIATKITLTAVTIGAVAFLHMGVDGLVYATAISTLAVSLAYVVYLMKSTGGRPMLTLSVLKPMFAYGFRSYVACLLAFCVLRINIAVVGYLLGVRGVGVYSVATQLADMIYLLPLTIGTMLSPKVSSGVHEDFTPRVHRISLIMLIAVCAVSACVAPKLIPAFFGSQFSGAVTPFLILLPGVVFLGLETILVKDLAGRGYPLSAVVAWAPVLLAGAVVTWILVPQFGLNGAAVASSISNLLIFILMLICYMRISKQPLNKLFIPSADDLCLLTRIRRSAANEIQ